VTAAEPTIHRPYLLFLPLIWAALRFGVRGAATAVFLVAAAAVSATATGHGPFVRTDPADSLFALHAFLAAAALASLLLGALTCELRDKAAMLRGLIDGTTDAVYVKDRLGRYMITNIACARVLGVKAEAPAGRDDSAVFPAGEALLLRDGDQEVVRTGQPLTFEDTLTIAGQARVYHTTKAPYCDRDGKVIGVIGISRDITDHKAEELAWAWLAAIVESSTDAVIGKTLDGVITSWNAAAAHQYGYSREEAIGQSIWLIVPPEKRDELSGFFDRIRRGERIESHETVRRRKDGTTIEVAVTPSPILDAAGVVVGVSAIGHDIDERKRLERVLRDSEERLRLAVEAAHLGVWSWDLEDDQLLWTPECKSMHGLGPDDEVTYERFLALIHPDDRDGSERAIQRALDGCSELRIEHRIVWPDGSLHWISGSGRALCTGVKGPCHMVGVSLDITAQKHADQERAALLRRERAARAEAQSATRAKDEFLAVLSHELRTPLHAILGWAEILRGPGADPRRMEKGLETITRNAKLQTQMIEDLLDISRIVAGKDRISNERVDLANVVAAAVESAKVAVRARSLRLDATIEPIERAVLGDPDRLQQIVSNLLANAVKFTSAGGDIHVWLQQRGSEAWLVVEDTGRGIAPELLPHIFERFRQGGSSTVRSHGGLGLGLAIVRHFVELHGGAVSAESDGEGRGARFTVRLPLSDDERRARAVGRATNGATPAAALRDVRVLVVDDDLDACELIELALRASGAKVSAVHSARAALEAMDSFRPQVLMSDIGMPEEDGYSLIRRVRVREATEGGRVPAIALTAFASQADREQALATGFDVHLTKPVSPGDLTRTVAKLVKQAA
jgi:PAS domain S-box-containing protein